MNATTPRTLTEYILTILPQPQIAAAAARTVGMALWTFGVGTIALWLYGDPFIEAVRTAGLGAFLGSGVFRMMEGVWDARRARDGSVRPWDVGPSPGSAGPESP